MTAKENDGMSLGAMAAMAPNNKNETNTSDGTEPKVTTDQSINGLYGPGRQSLSSCDGCRFSNFHMDAPDWHPTVCT